MSGHDNGAPFEQPASFAFTSENMEKAKATIAKYPAGRQASAVLSLLYLAQEQHDNWVPRAAMDHIAEILEMPPIKVYEVASFYTMFNLRPVGRYFLQVCTTTPCWLRGSDEVVAACKKKLGIGIGETTAGQEIHAVRGRMSRRLRQRADHPDQQRRFLRRPRRAGDREADRRAFARRDAAQGLGHRPPGLGARRRTEDAHLS